LVKISPLGYRSNRKYIGSDILKECSLASEKYNLLLIEENTADYFLILECLKRLKYDVNITRVRTAEEAKSYIQSFCETTDPPRLILSEFTIPGTDVYDILETIKLHRLLCDLPFIIFTSSENINLISNNQTLDATAVFSKPFDFHLYVETLRQIFEIVDPQTKVLPPEPL